MSSPLTPNAVVPKAGGVRRIQGGRGVSEVICSIMIVDKNTVIILGTGIYPYMRVNYNSIRYPHPVFYEVNSPHAFGTRQWYQQHWAICNNTPARQPKHSRCKYKKEYRISNKNKRRRWGRTGLVEAKSGRRVRYLGTTALMALGIIFVFTCHSCHGDEATFGGRIDFSQVELAIGSWKSFSHFNGAHNVNYSSICHS